MNINNIIKYSINLPDDFPNSSSLINDLPIPNWETMNQDMTPEKLIKILNKPKILVYCHPRSNIYSDPIHYMLQFIEERIKDKYGEEFKPNTDSIIYTLDNYSDDRISPIIKRDGLVMIF